MKKVRNILTNHSGFTLVELAVVLAILVILMTIAIVVYNDVAARKARELSCESNITNTIRALSAYSAEHDGYPPNLNALKGSYFKQNSTFDFKCPSSQADYQYDQNSGKVDCPTHNFDPSFP